MPNQQSQTTIFFVIYRKFTKPWLILIFHRGNMHAPKDEI